MKRNSFIFIVLFFLFVIALIVEEVHSQPTIIDIHPGVPTTKSNITFVAYNFVNESVENVTLYVHEFTNEICYNQSIIIRPMIKNNENKYEAQITLIYDDTTYIQYHVECISGGIVEKSPILELEIKTKNSETGSPAFEFLFIIGAIIIIIFILVKKRP